MQKGSSLYGYKFGNATKDEIIAKYELVLESRENQVGDLSMELGRVQEKLMKFEDRNEYLEKQVEIQSQLLKKKDFFLSQELQNKEIMFMRLQDKENEVDELKKKVVF